MSWHFEDDCEDATCGFRATTGSVQRTDTLIRGEHGMELSSGALVGRDGPFPWRGPLVQFQAWCEWRGDLRVELYGRNAGRPVVGSATFTVGPAWEVRQGGISLPGETPDTIDAVVFINGTPGRCRIDSIHLGGDGLTCPR